MRKTVASHIIRTDKVTLILGQVSNSFLTKVGNYNIYICLCLPFFFAFKNFYKYSKKQKINLKVLYIIEKD